MKIRKHFGMVGITREDFYKFIMPHLSAEVVKISEGKRGISVTLRFEINDDFDSKEIDTTMQYLIDSVYAQKYSKIN